MRNLKENNEVALQTFMDTHKKLIKKIQVDDEGSCHGIAAHRQIPVL